MGLFSARFSLCSTLLVATTMGCAVDGRDEVDDGFLTDFGDGGTGDDATDGGDGGGDGEGPGIKLDVAPGNEGGDDGGGEEGCTKVDFLFVIDNSSSMLQAQENLMGSFPGFIEAITAYENLEDFHVMVVDSDDTVGSCQNICNPPQGEEGICEGYTCGLAYQLGPCALTLGAGQWYPFGGGATNQDCGLPPGQHWMDKNQADVDETFLCMAGVGQWGSSYEQPARAMVESVTTQAQPGGCNEGFLRDDAILVITTVTNANPGTSDEYNEDEPDQWYDAMVASKNGDPEAIVSISFTSVSVPQNYYDKYAQFTQMFGERGFVENMGLEDFSEVFDEAVSTIEQTCNDFVPPG